MRPLIAATFLLVFSVSGCGGGAASTAGNGAAAVPKATATVTVTATPTTPAGVLRYGQTAHYKWGNVTVLKSLRDIAPDKSLPGSKTWMGVLVKTCATAQKKGKQVTIGWDAWSASDQQDGQYNSFAWTNVTEYPDPVYPMDRPLPVGQCARGWIVFNKPTGVHPVKVTYGPAGDDAVVWRL